MASVKDLIRNCYIIQKEMEKLTKTLNSNKVKIQSYFDEKKLKKLEIEPESAEGVKLVAQKEERCYIDYNVDAMQEKFDKELFNSLIVKDYEIIDIDGMISLLREAGVKPKDFKKLIRTIITLDTEALKQAFSLGDITKEDLEGCYTANIIKSIKIKEVK